MNFIQPSRWSLRHRITVGVISYLILLTLGVLANDFLVNERAEMLVWESLLEAELEYFIDRKKENPGYEWPDTETLELFVFDTLDALPDELAQFSPGLHDEVMIEGRERVLLVRDEAGKRLVLALEIGDLETREAMLRKTIFIFAGVVALILALLAALGVEWLLKPLRDLVRQIQGIRPDKTGQRLVLPLHSSAELGTIAESMNRYLERNEQFLEREKDFINMASHELRTPVAVMNGSLKLVLAETDIPSTTRSKLQQISHTVHDMNEMISLLLVLAKDPDRIDARSEVISLHDIVITLVGEYQPMATARGLTLVCADIAESTIVSSMPMAKCAIGNLLRNAIEHSHKGEVVIGLNENPTLVVENAGATIALDEISELYTRMVRSGSRSGGGIGLDLIARLCRHCGWELFFSADAETFQARLHFNTGNPA